MPKGTTTDRTARPAEMVQAGMATDLTDRPGALLRAVPMEAKTLRCLRSVDQPQGSRVAGSSRASFRPRAYAQCACVGIRRAQSIHLLPAVLGKPVGIDDADYLVAATTL